MKKIKFAYIAPIKYLDLVPEDSDFHLVLVHLLKNPAYAEFYQKKIERGDVVICDNSAFEFGKPMETTQLLDEIGKSGIKPTYVVAPDYPTCDWKKTIKSTEQFIKDVELEDFQVMGVPQSEIGDWRGWLNGYQEMLNIPEIKMIGMSILGIPNAFQSLTNTADIAFNRVFATNYILQNGLNDSRYETWHHYLGLGNGPRELLAQRQLGLIDSNDSSSPFWHGIEFIRFDETGTGLKDGKVKTAVDFDIKRYRIGDPYIEFNINWINKNILQDYDVNG